MKKILPKKWIYLIQDDFEKDLLNTGRLRKQGLRKLHDFEYIPSDMKKYSII